MMPRIVTMSALDEPVQRVFNTLEIKPGPCRGTVFVPRAPVSAA